MLIDTNIFIEIARKQKRFEECLDLMNVIKEEIINEDIYVTEFTLHALEALISRNAKDLLRNILLLIYDEKIKIYDSNIADDLGILSSMDALGFDFDDCLQYMATNKLQTYIVTFDKSFKEKGLEVKTPAQVLKKILV